MIESRMAAKDTENATAVTFAAAKDRTRSSAGSTIGE